MRSINYFLFFVSVFLVKNTVAQTFDFKVESGNTKGCEILSENIINTSTDVTNYTFLWKWGEGKSSELATNVKMSFTSVGKHTIEMYVFDKNKKPIDTVIKQDIISIFKNPTATIKTDNKNVCINKPITYSIDQLVSDASIVKWTWKFGDGRDNTVYSESSQSHSYNLVGTYPPKIHVYDANGCDNTSTAKSIEIVVSDVKPNVSFTLDKKYACAPELLVKFSNTTTPNIPIVDFIWNYNDGTASDTSFDASHEYTTFGNFYPSLTAIAENGCTNTKMERVELKEYKVSLAIFSGYLPVNDGDTVCPGDITYNLTATGLDANSDIRWDFGNDGSIEELNKYNITKNYTTETAISLKVSASDSSTCYAESIRNIHIEKPLDISFTPFDGFYRCENFTQEFIAKANQANVDFEWNVILETNPPYFAGVQDTFYFNPQLDGDYYVSLKATTANGCTKEIKGGKIVFDEPDPLFILKDEVKSGCVNTTINYIPSINFSSTEYDSITKVSWDFEGDGIIDTVVGVFDEVFHTFTDTGIFYGNLYAETKSGCKDSLILEPLANVFPKKVVTIGPKPEILFEITPTVLCASDELVFEDLSTLYSKYDTLMVNIMNKNKKSNTGTTPLVLNQGKKSTHIFNSLTDTTGYHDLEIILSDMGCRDTLHISDCVLVKGPISFPKVSFDCDSPFIYTFDTEKMIDATRWEWRIYQYDAFWNKRGSLLETITDQVEKLTYNFEELYKKNKDFQLMLWSENDTNNCTFEYGTEEINVRNIKAKLQITDSLLCKNDRIYFNYADSSNDVLNLRWQLFNESSLIAYDTFPNTADLIAEKKGKYMLKIIANDTLGCIDTDSAYYKAYQPQIDTLIATNPEDCLNLITDIKVTASDDTTITNYYWTTKELNPYDNTIKSTKIPQITVEYKTSGYRDIKIDVENSIGCRASKTFSDLIKPIVPYVNFNLAQSKFCLNTPTEITLNNNDPERKNAEHNYWNFGDSDSIFEINENSITHNYPEKEGIYTIKLVGELTAPNQRTCKDSLIKFVEYKDLFIKLELNNRSACYIPDAGIYPDIDIKSITTSPGITTTNKINMYLGDENGENYQLKSNDATIQYIPLPQVTGKTYYLKVELNQTDYAGCGNIADSLQVMVFDPEVEIIASKETICLGEEILFKLEPNQNINLLPHAWAMGDGTMNNESQQFGHTYKSFPTSGYFLVEFIIENDLGENKTTCGSMVKEKKIWVHEVEAKFSRGIDDLDTIGCAPFTVNLINNSLGQGNTYIWKVDDVEIGREKDITYTFNKPSTSYNVSLYAKNTVCEHDISKPVNTRNLPVGDFLTDTKVCDYETFNAEVLLNNTEFISWQSGTNSNMSTIQDSYAQFDPADKAVTLVKMKHSGYLYANLRSSEGCYGKDSVYVQVQTKPYYTGVPNKLILYYPDADTNMNLLTANKNTKILQTGEIYNVNNDSLAGITYRWISLKESPYDYMICSNCASPTIDLSCKNGKPDDYCNTLPTELAYMLIMTDSAGCYTVKDSIRFEISRDMKISVPSAFSPNGDGTNDILRARGWAYKEFVSLRIYNRWGQLVFETTDITKGWDGTFKGVPQNTDTYAYTLVATDYNDKQFETKGYITLLR
ncbi:MAG: PKD domain-containing protein [Bacteroidales bacterium]|nr:PKD domain-containing protein [Bacteroidales bacterium]